MIKENLIDWMPNYYTGQNVNAIQGARDGELQSYEASQERVIGDMYASTAQDIDKWENEYGLTPSEGSTLLQRQQQMLAYIRGSGGATTKAQLLTLINSYTGSDGAEIEEFPDQFLIKFTIPYISSFDIDDMAQMLYRFIQGHVDFTVEINDDLDVESMVYANSFASAYHRVFVPLDTVSRQRTTIRANDHIETYSIISLKVEEAV